MYDDGGGEALHAGGGFTSAFDSGDSYLAKWGCLDTSAPELACPPHVFVRDVAAPGEFVSFTVTAGDDWDPAPAVACVPPSGSFFPRRSTQVTCTATDASGNQATCQFSVVVEPSQPAPPPGRR